MNKLQKRIVRIVFLLSLITATITFAQISEEPKDWIRFGFNINPQLNFSKFSESSDMTGNLKLTALRPISFGFSYNAEIARRWGLEGGLNISRVGVRTVYSTSYPANNVAYSEAVSTTAQGLLSIPFAFRYLSLKNCFQNRKYIKLGVNFLFHPASNGIIASSSGTVELGPYREITETITWRDNSYLSPTLIIGMGIQKQLKSGHTIEIGIAYNKGFKELQQWDYSLNDSKKIYLNKIVNRGSFFGVDLKFFFKPLGYKRYKKLINEFQDKTK